MTLRLWGVLAAAAALLAAGCGGQDANQVIRDTASNMGRIRSGTLDLKLLVTPQGQGQPFGFTLRGPFKLGTRPLPVLRVRYTQIANGKQATATLVSDGRRGEIVSNGGTSPLSSAQAQQIGAAARQIQGAGGLAGLGIESWVKGAKVSDGGTVGGAPTDKITADLDLVNVANSLIGIARLAGRNVQQLQPGDAKRLADAVRSSSFVLYTGKKDRLLRKADLNAQLGFDVPPSLRAALGSLVGAKVEFDLGVANPNGPVSVSLP